MAGTVNYDLKGRDFSKIIVRDNIELTIQCGDKIHVNSSVQHGDIEDVIVENKNGVLLLEDDRLF